MQCDRLEWHILNGYFFDLLARGTDELRSGSFAGIIDWAYVFSGGSAERHVYARAGLELAKVLMRWVVPPAVIARSEEHTSELQSLMRISYAVFCLKKKT